MKKLRPFQWLLLLAFAAGTIWIVIGRSRNHLFQNEGPIYGTFYHIKYEFNRDLQPEILHELARVDSSMSMFIPQSVLSRLNDGETDTPDELLTEVFQLSQKVSDATQGAFDITVAPLVNAWGFGFKKGVFPTPQQVDSLRQLVGYQKVRLADGKIRKADPRVMLDCGAVAKGFALDVVARLFERYGIRNYMIEIGGEVIVRGRKPDGEMWKIGIQKPSRDSVQTEELQTVLTLTDRAMATSGNYRNFYYKNGRKYAHTVDPRTGQPVQHSLLSATVLAPTCAEADAYATAFMVLGKEGAEKVLQTQKQLKAYLIYTDAQGNFRTWMSPGFEKYIAR